MAGTRSSSKRTPGPPPSPSASTEKPTPTRSSLRQREKKKKKSGEVLTTVSEHDSGIVIAPPPVPLRVSPGADIFATTTRTAGTNDTTDNINAGTNDTTDGISAPTMETWYVNSVLLYTTLSWELTIFVLFCLYIHSVIGRDADIDDDIMDDTDDDDVVDGNENVHVEFWQW